MEMIIPLSVPLLRAELVVEQEYKCNKNKYKWLLKVIMPAPDRRFNASLCEINVNKHKVFMRSLSEARAKMLELSQKNKPATVWAKISEKSSLYIPWISCSSTNLRIHMNTTTQILYCDLSLEQADQLIDIFNSIPLLVKQAKKTLAE